MQKDKKISLFEDIKDTLADLGEIIFYPIIAGTVLFVIFLVEYFTLLYEFYGEFFYRLKERFAK